MRRFLEHRRPTCQLILGAVFDDTLRCCTVSVVPYIAPNRKRRTTLYTDKTFAFFLLPSKY